jgi:hypothetical protein
MKQHRSKHTLQPSYRKVDIKKEIAVSQLAALGAMALAFNETEAALDRLFYAATELTSPLQLEVSTRIGGLDGKIPITIKGAAQFLSKDDVRQLEELLGDGSFGLLKDYRDGAIHARHVNANTGIGVKVDRKARVYDYLIVETALNAAYDQLVAITNELDEAVSLLQWCKSLKSLASDDPKRAQVEEETGACRSRFQQCRTERLNLPPLPKFPSESELRAADLHVQQLRTATLVGEFQPWMYPHFHRQFAPALWNYIQNNQPLGSPPVLLHSATKSDDKKDK